MNNYLLITTIVLSVVHLLAQKYIHQKILELNLKYNSPTDQLIKSAFIQFGNEILKNPELSDDAKAIATHMLGNSEFTPALSTILTNLISDASEITNLSNPPSSSTTLTSVIV